MSRTRPAPHRRQPRTGPASLLAGLAAAAMLSGCMANPHPRPLAIARPATLPATGPASPTTTTTTAAPAAPEQSPTPASVPRPKKAPPAPRPVRPSDVVRAVHSLFLPAFVVVTQPAPRTRVGIDTIVYTRPEDYSGSLTIRHHTVAIHATPVSYTWHFGDGGTRTSTTPGAPYPRRTITHVYRSTGTVHPSVTTTYRLSYRLRGGSWLRLPGTYSAAGPGTALTVVRNP